MKPKSCEYDILSPDKVTKLLNEGWSPSMVRPDNLIKWYPLIQPVKKQEIKVVDNG